MEKQKKGPRWGVIAAVIGVLWIFSILGSGGKTGRSSTSSNYSPSSSYPDRAAADSSSTPRADVFGSSTGAYMDSREKQLYENDPSSMGYTDADRDFLREHGVSESEARAAETVLHRQGVDD